MAPRIGRARTSGCRVRAPSGMSRLLPTRRRRSSRRPAASMSAPMREPLGRAECRPSHRPKRHNRPDDAGHRVRGRRRDRHLQEHGPRHHLGERGARLPRCPRVVIDPRDAVDAVRRDVRRGVSGSDSRLVERREHRARRPLRASARGQARACPRRSMPGRPPASTGAPTPARRGRRPPSCARGRAERPRARGHSCSRSIRPRRSMRTRVHFDIRAARVVHPTGAHLQKSTDGWRLVDADFPRPVSAGSGLPSRRSRSIRAGADDALRRRVWRDLSQHRRRRHLDGLQCRAASGNQRNRARDRPVAAVISVRGDRGLERIEGPCAVDADCYRRKSLHGGCVQRRRQLVRECRRAERRRCVRRRGDACSAASTCQARYVRGRRAATSRGTALLCARMASALRSRARASPRSARMVALRRRQHLHDGGPMQGRSLRWNAGTLRRLSPVPERGSAASPPRAGCAGEAPRAARSRSAGAATAAARIKWTWKGASATTKTDFGNPLGATTYSLCLYDTDAGTTRILKLPSRENICALDNCWNRGRAAATRSREATSTRLRYRPKLVGKGTIRIVGKGTLSRRLPRRSRS